MTSSLERLLLIVFGRLINEKLIVYVFSFLYLGQNFVQPPTAQADVRLRRRLSDKDKERRLVRRSSSKRKDKENGGHGTGSSGTGSSDSPARVSGSGIIQDSTGTAGSSSLDLALTDSVTSSSTIPGEFCPSLVGSDQLTTPNSRSGSNSSVLKRTSSAETGSNCGGGGGDVPVASHSNNNHSLLCRTRSEDAAGSGTGTGNSDSPARVSSSGEVSEAGLTRSLPRI